MGARICLHRRWVPVAGHFHFKPKQESKRAANGTFLSAYLPIFLLFTAVHGFFLFMIIFLLNHNGRGGEIGLNFQELAKGCALVLLLLAVDFLADLPDLRRKPFAWLERKADLSLGRVFVVHLTLIFGMFAVAFTGVTKSFFSVFVGLKVLCDLSGTFPQWNPDKPPGWLSRVMDKIPAAEKNKGLTFAEFWEKDQREERERQASNEKPVLPRRK